MQKDGKIVVAGYEFSNEYTNINLEAIRYLSNGNLDSSFGENGRVIPKVGFSSTAYSVTIQNDGNILLAGSLSDSGKYSDFLVVRFLKNGKLDSSFGLNGHIRTDFFNYNDVAYSIALQSDEKILVGGRAFNNDNSKTLLASIRYNKNGAIDSSFGTKGKSIIELNGFSEIRSLKILPDGKIVAGGTNYINNLNFIILRFLPNGNLDSTFGNNGRKITDIYGGDDALKSIAIQKDGKIIAAGRIVIPPDSIKTYFEVVRYKENGKIDSSFGVSGKQTTDFNSSTNVPRALVLQTDNKIIVAGITSPGDTIDNFALAR